MSTIFILAVIFFFPYLMMSSIIKHENETETASPEARGILKSYGEQNNATKRYRRHMISIVFGVIVMLAICAVAI
jgi:hypothetical protein